MRAFFSSDKISEAVVCEKLLKVLNDANVMSYSTKKEHLNTKKPNFDEYLDILNDILQKMIGKIANLEINTKKLDDVMRLRENRPKKVAHLSFISETNTDNVGIIDQNGSKIQEQNITKSIVPLSPLSLLVVQADKSNNKLPFTNNKPNPEFSKTIIATTTTKMTTYKTNYDTIIQVDCFKDLLRDQWLIYKPRKSFNISDIYQCSIIGTTGKANKAKSYVIKCLLGVEPVNNDIEGINCLYPRSNDYSIAYLDINGHSRPLNMKTCLERNDCYEGDGLGSEGSTRRIGHECSKVSQSKQEMLKDKQFLDNFLQRFLIETSNLILIIISNLTFEDQMLIESITKEFSNKKWIYVVHNFFELTTINEVKSAIQIDILNIFDVKKIIIPFGNQNGQFNQEFYASITNTINDDIIRIMHIVMAKEATEAGNYYNKSAIDIIQNTIKICNMKTFNLEQEFLKYITKSLADYIDISESPDWTIELIQAKIRNGFRDLDSPWGLFKLSKFNQTLNFKKHHVDYFGTLTIFPTSRNEIDLPYILKENQDYLILQVEFPGLKHEDIQNKIFLKDNYANGEFFFSMESEKISMKDHENDQANTMKILYDNIPCGYVRFQSCAIGKLDQIKYFVDFTRPEWTYENGILTYYWKKNMKKKSHAVLMPKPKRENIRKLIKFPKA